MLLADNRRGGVNAARLFALLAQTHVEHGLRWNKFLEIVSRAAEFRW